MANGKIKKSIKELASSQFTADEWIETIDLTLNDSIDNYSLIIMSCSPLTIDRFVSIILPPIVGITGHNTAHEQTTTGDPLNGFGAQLTIMSKTSVRIHAYRWNWDGSYTGYYYIYGVI